MDRDYNTLASRYIRFLGYLNLVGLNFGGFILLWIARRIEERNNGFRLFYMAWSLVVIPSLLVLLLIWPKSEPVFGDLKFFNFSVSASQTLILAVLAFLVIVYAIPGVWLCRKDVRLNYGANKPIADDDVEDGDQSDHP